MVAVAVAVVAAIFVHSMCIFCFLTCIFLNVYILPTQAGAPIDNSFVKNMERFVVGFFASLFPAWQPQPA